MTDGVGRMGTHTTEFSSLSQYLIDHSLYVDGPYQLAAGATSSWYLDARASSFSGAGATLIGAAILSLIPPSVTAVGGMTMGADPLSIATVMTAHSRGRELKAFSVRKQDKEYGMGGRLVGPITSQDQVTVLEDTTTTGTALLSAIAVVDDYGATVKSAVALLDRSGGITEEQLKARGIDFTAIFLPSDLGITDG